MNQSPTIGALAAALAKAQGEIKGAIKDSANPFFKSKYADLTSVKDACQEALTKYNIAVIQGPRANGAQVIVTTMLAHESGEWVSEEFSAHAKDDSPQSVMACVTYLRRGGLAAMVGVAPEDDDGESAQPRAPYVPQKHGSQPSQQRGVEAAKDLIVATRNIEAAKAILTPDAHALDDRRRALWTRLKDLGMPAGAAADWVKTNRKTPPGSDMTVADFEKMEGMVKAIEEGKSPVTEDIKF
jgi:hypothetical protein